MDAVVDTGVFGLLAAQLARAPFNARPRARPVVADKDAGELKVAIASRRELSFDRELLPADDKLVAPGRGTFNILESRS